jgi:hypothetical protein
MSKYARKDYTEICPFKMNLLSAFGPPGAMGPAGGMGVGGPNTGAR